MKSRYAVKRKGMNKTGRFYGVFYPGYRPPKAKKGGFTHGEGVVYRSEG